MNRHMILAVGLFTFASHVAADEAARKFHFLDLQPHVNVKFADRPELEKLPPGEQTFGKIPIPFRLQEGLIQLANKTMENKPGDLPANDFAPQWLEYFKKIVEGKPERLIGIKLDERFTTLHFLHSAHLNNLRNDTAIGWYTVHYEDGSRSVVPIIYDYTGRVNVRGGSSAIALAGFAGVAWKGTGGEFDNSTVGNQLFFASWTNPSPAMKIAAIDFSGGLHARAAPFCVAITAEVVENAPRDNSPEAERLDDYRKSFIVRDLSQLATQGTPAAQIDTAHAIAEYALLRGTNGNRFLDPFLKSSDPNVQLAMVEGIEKRAAALGQHSANVMDLGSTSDKPGASFVRGPARGNGQQPVNIQDPSAGLKRDLVVLGKNAKDERVRDAAQQAWRRLEFPSELDSLRVVRGSGKPLTQHPGGKFKVVGGNLVDAEGKQVAELTTRYSRFQSVTSWAFSPDGRWLAVGIRDDDGFDGKRGGTISGQLRLFDVNAGKQIGYLGGRREGSLGPVESVSFSADGKTLQYEAGRYKEVIDGK